MALLAGGVAAGSPPPTPEPILDGPYGSGIGADALANTQVGGSSSRSPNLLTAYRFRATESAVLRTIRIYLVDGDGYAGGTGGTMTISLRSDGPGPGHLPSREVLASTTVAPGNPIAIGYLPLVTFPAPAILVAGELYHLVFENADPSPRLNYVSINALWTSAVTTPRQPTLADLDWAQLIDDGTGWTVRPNFTPILDLGYDNGAHAGVGYMEVWVNASRLVSGPNAVREVFTPTVSRVVSSISVRVRKLTGTSPLTLRLVESAGPIVVAQADVPAASFGTGAEWVTASLPAPVVLHAGMAYQLLVSAPADTSFSIHAIERGDRYHFAPTTYFADGFGQYTTGSTWVGFDQPGGTKNNTNSDLQFYLR
jgi:hypothetical protein